MPTSIIHGTTLLRLQDSLYISIGFARFSLNLLKKADPAVPLVRFVRLYEPFDSCCFLILLTDFGDASKCLNEAPEAAMRCSVGRAGDRNDVCFRSSASLSNQAESVLCSTGDIWIVVFA